MARALIALILLATACTVDAGSSASGPSPPAPGPSAPNEGAITAEVLDAAVIDSATVGIAPSQPLCVLTLRLLTVGAIPGGPNSVNAKAGQTIRAYSKDVSLAALKSRTARGTITFSGDERGGSFWVRTLSATAGAGAR